MRIFKSAGSVHAVIILLILAIILSSCANLPGKENGPRKDNGPQELPVSPSVEDDHPAEKPGGEVAPVVWSEPDPGITVTPIVLMIEKKGDDSALIIRQEDDADLYSDGGTYFFDSNVNDISAQSTPVPAAIAPVLKDEMKVYSFSPVSGSVVLPNQALHLDVMLKNSGTTTWQTNYKIVDYSNMPMTVQREYSLPYAVAPDGTVLISIYMTSPSQLGSFPANFQIQDSSGNVFGQFDYILTVGGFSSITEIPTLTATLTPTYYSAEGITATPDTLAWMCIDPERSKLQDCYRFCVEYSHREEFKYCFYDGERYTTPIP